MPRRKQATSSKGSVVSFHCDFKHPTVKERSEALGELPHEAESNDSRHEMLLQSATFGQPSLQARREIDPNINEEESGLAVSDLNDRKLYSPTPRSETSLAIPRPRDKLDWLAQVPEEGQSFEAYLTPLTTRKTGRIRPHANPQGIEVLLLPIIRAHDYPSNGAQKDHANPSNLWPAHGPPLSQLVEYTRYFFDRRVRLLPAAQLYAATSNINKNNKQTGSRKKQKVKEKSDEDLGSFASATAKGKFKLFLSQSDGSLGNPVNIAGRADFKSDRMQLQVISLLDELSTFRCRRQDAAAVSQSPNEYQKDFCIMAITMEDLYDGPSDLFCAGMAFGRDKVAAFSFARYHPFLKMHPLHWYHYGYAKVYDGYSYYEDGNQNPKGLMQDPPPMIGSHISDEVKTEFFRRSSKLLTHELGHLYNLDHCIYNRCLMMGTAHLVEDFKAPSHLCGICLRKLQWRTGFDVRMRYKLLATAFANMGMTKEQKWAEKQFDHIS